MREVIYWSMVTALCKRDVGAGGQNFKKATILFFYRI